VVKQYKLHVTASTLAHQLQQQASGTGQNAGSAYVQRTARKRRVV
jgi:hypothetical protein